YSRPMLNQLHFRLQPFRNIPSPAECWFLSRLRSVCLHRPDRSDMQADLKPCCPTSLPSLPWCLRGLKRESRKGRESNCGTPQSPCSLSPGLRETWFHASALQRKNR